MRAIVTGLTAAGLFAAVALSPPAQAADEWALNGVYTATSNGEWATIDAPNWPNNLFAEQASVRAVWTVSSQCSYPSECTGTVTSNQGWNAPIYQTGSVWYVKHVVPNWVSCPDGSTAPGYQIFRFRAMTPDGADADPTSNVLVGEDLTTTPSGACGRSRPVYIAMPFKISKLS